MEFHSSHGLGRMFILVANISVRNKHDCKLINPPNLPLPKGGKRQNRRIGLHRDDEKGFFSRGSRTIQFIIRRARPGGSPYRLLRSSTWRCSLVRRAVKALGYFLTNCRTMSPAVHAPRSNSPWCFPARSRPIREPSLRSTSRAVPEVA